MSNGRVGALVRSIASVVLFLYALPVLALLSSFAYILFMASVAGWTQEEMRNTFLGWIPLLATLGKSYAGQLGYALFSLVEAVAVCCTVSGRPLREFLKGIGAQARPPTVALVPTVVLGVVLAALGLILQGLDVAALALQRPPAWVYTISVIQTMSWVVPGVVAEELLFRGYVLPTLADAWGWPFGIAFSSIVFGFAHLLAFRGAGASGALGDFLFSLLASYIFLLAKEIWAPVAFHIGWDFVSYAVQRYAMLAGTTAATQFAALTSSPTRPVATLIVVTAGAVLLTQVWRQRTEPADLA